MESDKYNFYFDKTDLFKKIKRIEELLGLHNNFNADDINVRLASIEQTLNAINANYTTKTYVDNKLIEKVNKAGDTLIGNLSLLAVPTENNNLVTKEYADNILEQLNAIDLNLLATKAYVDGQTSNLNSNITTQLGNKISKFGDVLYGELILANNATQPLHPVSKQQFDLSMNGVALTGNLDW